MGYEDQIREAERILDKMNAARQPDNGTLKRLHDLEVMAAILSVTCLILLAAVLWLVATHLGR